MGVRRLNKSTPFSPAWRYPEGGAQQGDSQRERGHPSRLSIVCGVCRKWPLLNQYNPESHLPMPYRQRSSDSITHRLCLFLSILLSARNIVYHSVSQHFALSPRQVTQVSSSPAPVLYHRGWAFASPPNHLSFYTWTQVTSWIYRQITFNFRWEKMLWAELCSSKNHRSKAFCSSLLLRMYLQKRLKVMRPLR